MTAHPVPDQPAATHYKEPDWFTRNVLNRLLNGLTRLGVSVMGSRVLEHRGRTSGKLFHTPVNLLTIEGTEYLVSPRGETQWVRNVRHEGGHLVLILGRRRRECTATQVPPADAAPISGPTYGAGSSRSGCSSTACHRTPPTRSGRRSWGGTPSSCSAERAGSSRAAIPARAVRGTASWWRMTGPPPRPRSGTATSSRSTGRHPLG